MSLLALLLFIWFFLFGFLSGRILVMYDWARDEKTDMLLVCAGVPLVALIASLMT